MKMKVVIDVVVVAVVVVKAMMEVVVDGDEV